AFLLNIRHKIISLRRSGLLQNTFGSTTTQAPASNNSFALAKGKIIELLDSIKHFGIALKNLSYTKIDLLLTNRIGNFLVRGRRIVIVDAQEIKICKMLQRR